LTPVKVRKRTKGGGGLGYIFIPTTVEQRGLRKGEKGGGMPDTDGRGEEKGRGGSKRF